MPPPRSAMLAATPPESSPVSSRMSRCSRFLVAPLPTSSGRSSKTDRAAPVDAGNGARRRRLRSSRSARTRISASLSGSAESSDSAGTNRRSRSPSRYRTSARARARRPLGHARISPHRQAPVRRPGQPRLHSLASRCAPALSRTWAPRRSIVDGPMASRTAVAKQSAPSSTPAMRPRMPDPLGVAAPLVGATAVVLFRFRINGAACGHRQRRDCSDHEGAAQQVPRRSAVRSCRGPPERFSRRAVVCVTARPRSVRCRRFRGDARRAAAAYRVLGPLD